MNSGTTWRFLTVLKLHAENDAKSTAKPLSTAKLVLARLTPQGTLLEQTSASLSDNAAKRKERQLKAFIALPPDNLPLPELSMLPNLPDNWMQDGKWDTPEFGRPFRHSKLELIEPLRGARCHLISTQQQSEDWGDTVRGRMTWRIQENIWYSTAHGFSMKMERIFERKDANTSEVTFRTKLNYEHTGQLRYSGRAYDERREEITMAKTLDEDYEKIVDELSKNGPSGFSRILGRIDYYTESQRPLGESLLYREALHSLKRKAEAAIKGHLAPSRPQWVETPSGPLTVNKPIIDFEAENLMSSARENWRLSQAKGKPIVLVYYQPHAGTAEAVLKAGEFLRQDFRARVRIVGMAIGDPIAARKQGDNVPVNFPIINATDLRKAQGIESTPTIVLVDGEGVIRKISVGWGDESLGLLREELGKLIK
jgi:hypothetical protein